MGPATSGGGYPPIGPGGSGVVVVVTHVALLVEVVEVVVATHMVDLVVVVVATQWALLEGAVELVEAYHMAVLEVVVSHHMPEVRHPVVVHEGTSFIRQI
jgi:hypothetical protein